MVSGGKKSNIIFVPSTVWSGDHRQNWKGWERSGDLRDNQAETCLIIKINDTCTGDLPLMITISDTSKNQPKRLDSYNQINQSRLIVSLAVFGAVFVGILTKTQQFANEDADIMRLYSNYVPFVETVKAGAVVKPRCPILVSEFCSARREGSLGWREEKPELCPCREHIFIGGKGSSRPCCAYSPIPRWPSGDCFKWHAAQPFIARNGIVCEKFDPSS